MTCDSWNVPDKFNYRYYWTSPSVIKIKFYWCKQITQVVLQKFSPKLISGKEGVSHSFSTFIYWVLECGLPFVTVVKEYVEYEKYFRFYIQSGIRGGESIPETVVVLRLVCQVNSSGVTSLLNDFTPIPTVSVVPPTPVLLWLYRRIMEGSDSPRPFFITVTSGHFRPYDLLLEVWPLTSDPPYVADGVGVPFWPFFIGLEVERKGGE